MVSPPAPSNPKLVYTPNVLQKRGNEQANDYLSAKTGVGVTDYLPCSGSNVIKYFNPNTQYAEYGNLGHVLLFKTIGEAYYDWWNCGVSSVKSFTVKAGSQYFRLNIVMDGEEDSYCYNETTGVVYYAGRNTPYYGKTNIND